MTVSEERQVDDCTAPERIDPERLALCLSVLAEAERLPPEHPDTVRLRRATAGLYKSVKLRRRRDRTLRRGRALADV